VKPPTAGFSTCLFGDLDVDAPPVVGVAYAPGVSGFLEAVDERGDGAGGEPGPLGELAGGQRTIALEVVDAAHVGAVEAEGVGDGLVVAVGGVLGRAHLGEELLEPLAFAT
jgi:hypothetical protein